MIFKMIDEQIERINDTDLKTLVSLLCEEEVRLQDARPPDRVNRQFKVDRPNQLWASDFIYVSTWQGWQYAAFVIDVYARRIAG